MQLSFKQIAIFGQVKVNLMPKDSKFVRYMTLLDAYKLGWWATERFGTIIFLVRPCIAEKDGFKCVAKRIVTDVDLDILDEQIKIIADKKFEHYKHRLTKRKKNESDLPVV